MSRIRAVIFDWAGTMVDFGALTSIGSLAQSFAEFGLVLGTADLRKAMGIRKSDHIAALLAEPLIAARWQEVHGILPDRAAVARLHEHYVTRQTAAAARVTFVPGALDTAAWLRAEGIRIGSTTSSTRAIMGRVSAAAAAQGYAPDTLVCTDDLAEGRPGPLMIYKCFADLGVYPPQSVIKVDDTEPGIAEGRAAGCITVGVTLSGNEAGFSAAEIAALPEAKRNDIRRRARARFKAAGADHVIDTVADLPSLIQTFDARDLP
ncbi:phosphonoacetaldehyde hydrolase [Rhodobacter viridis]|uniref:Phosphonoacetaldehyde hydrolase n=1 Tax=Rhodobacter viridis TaxID=1054202 RepID=A0A318TU07_9RHOB|nr:phosphonoacetaldehyde hydrolase [Rhodobacter viridis]PYF08124.1 phosphonoacetaldehyde hydrolase [Rhodobacter viridis]